MANHRTKNRNGRTRIRIGEDDYNEESEVIKRQGRGWINASPMAWVSAVVSLVSLGGMLYQLAFSQATIFTSIENIKVELARNFKEDDFTRDRHIKNIERIDTTIGSMGKLNVEMEVVKTKLDGLTEAVKDLKRSLERGSRKMHTPPPS